MKILLPQPRRDIGLVDGAIIIIITRTRHVRNGIPFPFSPHSPPRTQNGSSTCLNVG